MNMIISLIVGAFASVIAISAVIIAAARERAMRPCVKIATVAGSIEQPDVVAAFNKVAISWSLNKRDKMNLAHGHQQKHPTLSEDELLTLLAEPFVPQKPLVVPPQTNRMRSVEFIVGPIIRRNRFGVESLHSPLAA